MREDLYSHYVQIIRENMYKYDGKELVIFPFGQQGMVFKNTLNHAYGIYENYIVDNSLCKYNKNILSIDELEHLDSRKLLFFLSTTDKELNYKLYNIIKSKFPNSEIINLIEPLIIPVKNKENYFKELKNLLRVKLLVSDKQYLRIGKRNDGGYIMLDDFDSKMRAYSFGICDDVSWDKEMADRYEMDIYMYDHTISRLPEYHKKFHYFKAGISGRDDSINNVFSLETLLRNNRDLQNKNLILKMDVEGAEYDFIENTSSDIINNFREMVFELHNITKSENQSTVKKTLEKINKTHQAVWVHGNNFNYAECENHVIMPNTIEVLYLNKSYYSFKDSEIYFPWEIDSPNRYGMNDFSLGNWGSENS